MKIQKNFLIILLFTFFSCNSDQSNLDIITEHENISVNQTNSIAAYGLDEILNGMRTWDNLRTNKSALIKLFNNRNGFNINLGLFPANAQVHAYPCIIQGALKFAVISEVYDKVGYKDSINNYILIVDVGYKDISNLRTPVYQNYTFPLPTQYIPAADAITRIEDWNTNYATWLNSDSFVYKGFDIPTYSLAAQNYTVYFGLKNNIENPIVKDADLVFYNNNGAFYDTVTLQPPTRDRQKYYLSDLI